MVRITGNAEVRPANVSQSLRQKSGDSGKTSVSAFLFTIILHEGRSSFLNAYYLGDFTLLIPIYLFNSYSERMRQKFLEFMKHVVSDDCPFYNFSVNKYRSYIEVRFIITISIFPDDLRWLNTHLVDSRWFITTEGEANVIVVRFEETDED